MSLHLNGIALITGAGHGIGRECALGYAAEGVKGIILADTSYDAALDAAQESETVATNPAFTAVATQVDMTDPASIAGMVSKAMKTFGRVDYYVDSTRAGYTNLPATGSSEQDRIWQDSAEGTLHCIHAVAQVMKSQAVGKYKYRGRVREAGRGSIVTVGAPSTDLGRNTVAEDAVLRLIRKAAIGLATCGIRVNTVCPGLTDDVDPVLNEKIDPLVMKSAVPMTRPARPEEIADIALFLSSPRASYVTGAAWAVDGGMKVQAEAANEMGN
ncbi:SDR family NAD(P)-dependent oxidoreductase [Aspergillus puulaauensis]|uniref:Oxidoreductase n=1 Tax=Aspergillus puulaauensis TaxID=1220207 RepID=A0A7R8AUD7_9EURO|nr:uncharacterized protein APUU_80073S [Aspergillus puulaauensis]BCS29770.1 hypothetical protein APUU_80073S [Aspergillus puulaauensis]